MPILIDALLRLLPRPAHASLRFYPIVPASLGNFRRWRVQWQGPVQHPAPPKPTDTAALARVFRATTGTSGAPLR